MPFRQRNSPGALGPQNFSKNFSHPRHYGEYAANHAPLCSGPVMTFFCWSKLRLLRQKLLTSCLGILYSRLLALGEWGFRGLSGSPAPVVEEVAEQSGCSLCQEPAFDSKRMVEAGIGGGVMQGTGISGFGIGSRVDQAGETAGVGGAGAHGAWLQRSVEGATGQAPGARGGGCATDRE